MEVSTSTIRWKLKNSIIATDVDTVMVQDINAKDMEEIQGLIEFLCHCRRNVK